MQINFDLDEFIAYLLYGALLLAALSSVFALDVSSVYPGIAPTGSAIDTTTKALLLGALVFVAGHACSVVSRQITRRLIWCLMRRPREQIFSEKQIGFWDGRTKEIFRRKLKKCIFPNINLPSETELKRIAPRLIRSFVLANSPTFVEVRTRIVRSRSMCANAVLPLMIFTYANFAAGQIATAVMFALATVLMLVKQHDLDVREWKEVYTFFLATKDESANTDGDEATDCDQLTQQEVASE